MFKPIAALCVLFAAVTLAAYRLIRTAKSGRKTAVSQGRPQGAVLVEATDAAKRCMCLASILARTNLEHEAQQGPRETPSQNSEVMFQREQRHLLERSAVLDALSLRERILMEKPYGSWSTQEIASGQWRAEALGVLLWALNRIRDFPPYDTETPAPMVLNLLPPPRRGACARFVRQAVLRNEAEIKQARSIAELWLWRARTTQVQMSGAVPPDGWTFEKIIAMTAAAAQHERKLFTPIEDDFPALNKPYSKLSEDEWRTLRSIAQERLYALNWLCRYAEDWDAVPTGT